MLSRFFKRKKLLTKDEKQEGVVSSLDMSKMPVHVAIIMDGNGRWAVRQGLPRSMGHRAGVESLRTAIKSCIELGIKILTVYAFSTENWKRPREEVNILMNLLIEYLQKELTEIHQNGVCIRPIGVLSDLPLAAQEELAKAVELTKDNTTLILNLALNYGARLEIVEACRQIAAKVVDGKMFLEEIDERVFSEHLYTAGMPDPDLIIRPSGEMRVSNFLLWQLAYAELWVTNVMWPDFRKEHLIEAIIAYQKRDRRFGGLK